MSRIVGGAHLVNGGELGDQRIVDVRSKLLIEPGDSAKIISTGE
jgi:hypothetical protein